jgi:glycosyltransferase involved in cell wall biosynthesis
MNKDMHKISVIIPCFNCKDTVEDALKSVYQQNLSIPYEVVMVDDGSTDGTRDLITELSKKYPNVNYFFHEKNKGGGAARNTCVKKSTGDLIFCLDSDDMLAAGTLGKMVDYLLEKNCDAVGISRSIQFNGKNVNDVAYIYDFDYVGDKIPFSNLFGANSKCSLYSTFLFTKKSFYIAGGYPEDHGFDTQGFAFRFLANGLSACVCPGSIYLHRVNDGSSYYIREYEEGRASHNWFEIFEEFLFLFNDAAKEFILNYDLNDHKKPLFESLNYLYSLNNLLNPKYNLLIKQSSKEAYRDLCLSHHDDCTKYDYYWLGSEMYRSKDYSKAVDYFVLAIKTQMNNNSIYYKLFDSLCKINHIEYPNVIKKIDNFNKLNKLVFQKRTFYIKVKDKIMKYSPFNKIFFDRIRFKLNIIWLKYIKNFLGLDVNLNNNISSDLKIDVVFPTIDREADVLPYVIDSIREFVRHPIGDIFIVAPDSGVIKDICKNKNCKFIDESTLLPITKKDIIYNVDGLDRSGWVYQQLLKWSADKFVNQKYFLITESDTVFSRPRVFEYKGKIIFPCSDEPCNIPYFEAYERIFGEKVDPVINFTSHHSLFDKDILSGIKKEIEVRSGLKWYESIIKNLDTTCVSSVSDYESYGQFVKKHFRNTMILEFWGNLSLSRKELNNFSKSKFNYKKYKAVSFHHYQS